MKQCPTCGHFVKTIFDHLTIDCESDMTVEEIAILLLESESDKNLTPSPLEPLPPIRR
jgi:hypothetical protein